MGKHVTFAVESWTPAPASTVFALLCDGATWPGWSPIGSFKLLEEAPGGGEDVGAKRAFHTGPFTSRERLVEITPDTRFTYSLFKGMPMKEHLATVELAPRDGGTAITWTEDFVANAGRGWMLERFLTGFVQKCADGLAARATELSEDGPDSNVRHIA